MTIFPGPTPPYTNPEIHPEFYIPSRFNIEDVTLGTTTIVETDLPHNYVIGQLCRLLIPSQSGCSQLNEISGLVISIPSIVEVELNIMSAGGNTFITTTGITQPQIVAIGDINSGQINNLGTIMQSTFIPGSFRNISPL
jgi:hypothetical protein